MTGFTTINFLKFFWKIGPHSISPLTPGSHTLFLEDFQAPAIGGGSFDEAGFWCRVSSVMKKRRRAQSAPPHIGLPPYVL